MKPLVFALITLTTIGCHESFLIDTTPPAPPQGIVATAMDNATEVRWLENQEPDVAGYKVWISDRYDGRYEVIGTTHDMRYVDHGAQNGVRVYYALTAYDFDGNESDLSADVVYATPRPEGFGTKISNYRTSPQSAGYDFSTYSIGDYDDDYTDVFFEATNGRFYLNVWNDSDIQDMGFTNSLYDIAFAPPSGWSPSRSVEAIVGHTYVIWTWDDHYAKIRVRDITQSRIMVDWAYQVAKANPELKRGIAPGGGRALQPKLLSVMPK